MIEEDLNALYGLIRDSTSLWEDQFILKISEDLIC